MKRIENSRMARKLILLLVLSLLRQTTSVSGEGPITLRRGSHAVAMEAARGKHLTTTQLGQVMKRNHVTTAWATDIEVCNLPRWTWEDGSDHTEDITTNGFYRRADQLCGTVKPSIGIDDHACFKHLDYICSFPDLSRTDPNGTCISKYERSFCLYKDRCNYFSARDKCRDKGGILAILPGTQSADKQVSSLTDDIFPKYDQDERAWIGTRKVDICAVLDDGSVTFARHIRWPPDQPNFNFRCLVWKLDNQAMQMMTANCSEDHAYFLVKEDKISYTNAGSALVYTAPPKGRNKGFVVKADVVIVCSVIMIVFIAP